MASFTCECKSGEKNYNYPFIYLCNLCTHHCKLMNTGFDITIYLSAWTLNFTPINKIILSNFFMVSYHTIHKIQHIPHHQLLLIEPFKRTKLYITLVEDLKILYQKYLLLKQINDQLLYQDDILSYIKPILLKVHDDLFPPDVISHTYTLK